MSKRLVGLETEYSIVFWDKEAGKLLPGSEFQKMIEEALGELGLGGNYLENGARLYIDQGTHPEYATPECSSAEDVVKCDKAGERIMETVCRHLNDKHRAKGVFYMHKDNSDRKGNSFGCHENYLIRVGENKFAAWQYKIAPILLTFLTTRQILCGAGKIGKEEPTLSGRNFLPLCMPQENDAVGQEEEFHPNLENDPYQISQRADFLDIVWGESNRERKCFIADKSGTNNHCDIASYRRLHVTCGDANMSEYSAYLKIGTALAVLDLLEDEKFLANLDKAPIVRNPLTAVKAISRDPGLKVKVALACGGEMTAIEIQRWFLKEALKYQARNRVKGTTAGDPKLLKEWSDTLDKLEKNPGLLVKKIDWLIKKTSSSAIWKAGAWIGPIRRY